MGAVAEAPEKTEAEKAAEAGEQAKKADADAAKAAGEPLDGEHADETGEQGKAEKAPEPSLELQGEGQLSLKIAGPVPNKATAKMVGGKIAIPEGEYQPGEVIEAVVRIQCTKVSVIDKMNNGERTEREREHQFKLRQIERVNA